MQSVNIFWVRQKESLNALIRLLSYGVTDKESLNIHEFVNPPRL
jgi:hypothetical protein